MGRPINLILGVGNILMAAKGWPFAGLSFLVGFALLLLYFGAFGPYEGE